MKKMATVLGVAALVLMAWAAAFVPAARAAGTRKLTVMVYVCGSNLESEHGAASADMAEMQAAMSSDEVSLLVMTGGSVKWGNGLKADKNYITEIAPGNKKRIVDAHASMSMGDPQTLTYLVRFAMERYPAGDYALIIWNHGNGPLGGVCMDEMYIPDTLSLREIGDALTAAQLPDKLKWIGFDACLMSTVEVANAVAPHAEYMIASQDTEPASGWNYGFLDGIEGDADAPETGRRIIDLYMQTPHGAGEPLTLSCTDLSKVGGVVSEMDAFFGPLSETIDEGSFSAVSSARLSAMSFGGTVRGVGVDGYDLVDLLDLARKYGDEGDARSLSDALAEAVVYARPAEPEICGLSIYHPFYNKAMFMQNWAMDYRNLEFCPGYSRYVSRFGSILVADELADWGALETVDEGYAGADANWFSLQLTPEQRESFSSAQLIALYPYYYNYSASGQLTDRFTHALDRQETHYGYSPVYIGSADMDENGLVTARYTGRALYVTDATGAAVLGPIAYRLSPDGQTYYVSAEYADTSGSEDAANTAKVLYACRLDGADALSIVRTDVYDPLTDTYSNRAALDTARYTRLTFDNLAASQPLSAYPMPGFDEWERIHDGGTDSMPAQEAWSLRFFDFQQSGVQIFAAFQVTDAQQNTFLSTPMPVRNPNLEEIAVNPARITRDGGDIACYVIRDVSPREPSMSLCLEAPEPLKLDAVVVNGSRTVDYMAYYEDAGPKQAGALSYGYAQFTTASLTGLDAIRSIDVWVNGDPEPLTYYPEACEISDIAPRAEEPLAEASREGVAIQLVKLVHERGGDLSGVFHIVNRSGKAFDFDFTTLELDGLCLSGGVDWVRVRPDTDGYSAFTVENQVYLNGTLDISGRDARRFLALDRLHERYAGDEVRRLGLHASWRRDDAWHFELNRPLSLNGEGDAAGAEAALSLLDGEVEVEVTRVLVADNGVCARMVMRNRTDRDVQLQIDPRTIDGAGFIEDSTSLRDSMTCFIPARCAVVTCFGMRATDLHSRLNPGYDIHEFGFTVRRDADAAQMVRVRFDQPVTLGAVNGTYLSSDRLSARVEPWFEDAGVEALCEAEADGVTWQLIRLEADADGRLTGWLRAVNTTDEHKDYWIRPNALLVEGVTGDAHVPGMRLPPRSSQYFPFTFENCARINSPVITIPGTTGYAMKRVDHLLQREGVESVSRLTLVLGVSYDILAPLAQKLEFTLPEPLPVPPAADEPLPKSLLMRDGGVSVWLFPVVVGDRGISLAMELRNDSDEDYVFRVTDTYIDEHNAAMTLSNAFGCLCAHSVGITSADISAETEDRASLQTYMVNFFNSEDAFQDISTSFEYAVGDLYRYCAAAQIHMKAPIGLTKASGRLLTDADYEVEPARDGIDDYPNLVDVLSVPLADTVRPRTLVAPVDPARAARFERGEATIYIRTHDEEEWQEISPHYWVSDSEGFDPDAESVSFSLVEMDLRRDEQGRVSARYSGLIPWVNSEEFVSFRERTDGARTELTASLYTYPENEGYFNYRMLQPEDPSAPLCLAPLDVPDDDAAGIDRGVRTDLRYVLARDEGGLVVRERVRGDFAQFSGEPRDGEAENMDWWLMLMRRINDDDCARPELFYRYVGYEGFIHLSMIPIERIDREFFVVYHIRYTDGTEETFAEDY